LIQNGEHEATVKMYQRSPARFEPCSTNEDHKSFLVAETDFTVIGKVVWKGAPVR
jgi:phage repressor protein C with HTH and peptisase S24 domain